MRNRADLTWFEFGLCLFAAAVPVGLVLVLIAPVPFFHALGALVLGLGAIGMWVSALGLQLEHPERWTALKAWFRSVAPAPAPAPRRWSH